MLTISTTDSSPKPGIIMLIGAMPFKTNVNRQSIMNTK